MQLAFELSGEHETLPKAEVFACLDALSIAYEARMLIDRVLVIDVELAPERGLLGVLSRRLGLTHRIYEVKGMSALDETEILELVEGVDLSSVMNEGDTFAVRARFARKNSLYSKRQELRMKVGECIKGQGYYVNLDNPSKTFVLLFAAQACLFCSLLHSVDKAQFWEKRPHFRAKKETASGLNDVKRFDAERITRREKFPVGKIHRDKRIHPDNALQSPVAPNLKSIG